jgi:6-pyruvoyltetrahydropterin/6-carboxytetrahydropterin synthase
MIISKRFEFSAAHQVPQASVARERRQHGHNYVLRVGVQGEPDAVTGMVINLADLKARVEPVLDRYDHRNLNSALPSPGPEVESVSAALWAGLSPGVGGAALASVAVAEDDGNAAVTSPEGTRSVARGEFAAAHRTHIPAYSDEANLALFGICNNAAGHGHNYRLRVEAFAPSEALAHGVREAMREFDHRNLSVDIPDLAGGNVTTEVMAKLLWERLAGRLSVEAGGLCRIRLNELSDFFAEYAGEGSRAYLGRRYTFFAAHRLASPRLSPAENEAIYGKCSRPDPHGHSYRVEVTVAGDIDSVTGLAFNLPDLNGPAIGVVGALDGRNLEAEVSAFQSVPSTGEAILAYLWSELGARFGEALERVRLWETRNNCFEMDRTMMEAGS